MSTRYCKTKDGNIYKIWSDNVEDETMHVYAHDEIFDPESTWTKVIDYADIKQVDTNLAVLQ